MAKRGLKSSEGISMSAVSYCRVSSKEQEQEGYSIPAQQKLLREYAEKNGITILQEFCDVESAKASGRSQFGAMLGYLRETPSVKNILVEKTDRLYRNLKDYVLIDELNLNLHLVKEGVILNKDSKSQEKFFNGIKVLMAKQYVDNLSEEVRKGMTEKASQGIYPSMAPIGYLNVTRDGKKVLDVDPVRGPLIAKLFELYAGGQYSLITLAPEAKRLGLVHRKSKRSFSRGLLEKILKNPIYQGDVRWKGKIYQGKHTPLVSRKLFQAVQERFMSRNKPQYQNRGFAFLGLLTCGYCGCSITAEIKKGKYVYYHCTSGKGKCPNQFVREEELEMKLSELVVPFSLPKEPYEFLKQALQQSHDEKKAFHEQHLNRLQARQNELEQKIALAYDDKLEGKIDENLWLRKTKEWKEEQVMVRAEIERYQSANWNYVDMGVQLIELAEKAPVLYSQRSSHEKAKLLKMLLSNCTLKDKNLSPVYRKPFNILIEMAQSDNWRGREESNLQPWA